MASKQILPVQIISKTDVVRLKRELEALDESLNQRRLRKGGEPTALPKITPMLEDFAAAAKSNLLHNDDREKLLKLTDTVGTTSPVIHISFATTPAPAFLQKLVKWFREEIHPTTLIHVGLQPGIAAGCIVRTPNKQFDFSLKNFLAAKQDMLVQQLRGEA